MGGYRQFCPKTYKSVATSISIGKEGNFIPKQGRIYVILSKKTNINAHSMQNMLFLRLYSIIISAFLEKNSTDMSALSVPFFQLCNCVNYLPTCTMLKSDLKFFLDYRLKSSKSLQKITSPTPKNIYHHACFIV